MEIGWQKIYRSDFLSCRLYSRTGWACILPSFCLGVHHMRHRTPNDRQKAIRKKSSWVLGSDWYVHQSRDSFSWSMYQWTLINPSALILFGFLVQTDKRS
jgi:hypothetical protein